MRLRFAGTTGTSIAVATRSSERRRSAREVRASSGPTGRGRSARRSKGLRLQRSDSHRGGMDASSQRPIVEPWAATTTTDPRTITSWSWRAESARTISGKYRPRSRPRSETTCAGPGPIRTLARNPSQSGSNRQSRPSGRWSRASPASGTSGSETRSRATSTTAPLLAPHATTFASPAPARHREDGRDRLSRWSGRAVRERAPRTRDPREMCRSSCVSRRAPRTRPRSGRSRRRSRPGPTPP